MRWTLAFPYFTAITNLQKGIQIHPQMVEIAKAADAGAFKCALLATHLWHRSLPESGVNCRQQNRSRRGCSFEARRQSLFNLNMIHKPITLTTTDQEAPTELVLSGTGSSPGNLAGGMFLKRGPAFGEGNVLEETLQ